MAVYKSKDNNEQSQKFIVTENVMHEESSYCFFIEINFDSVEGETFYIRKVRDMSIIKSSEWEATLDFTGPMAVFHFFIRK